MNENAATEVGQDARAASDERRPNVESTEPNIPRLATDADLVLAGELSTVWPMNNRHPQDALHLAIFVNDRAAGVVPLPDETPDEVES